MDVAPLGVGSGVGMSTTFKIQNAIFLFLTLKNSQQLVIVQQTVKRLIDINTKEHNTVSSIPRLAHTHKFFFFIPASQFFVSNTKISEDQIPRKRVAQRASVSSDVKHSLIRHSDNAVANGGSGVSRFHAVFIESFKHH